MCVASTGTNVVEVTLLKHLVETDGYSVMFRLSRRDLETMLRVIDEEESNQDWCPEGVIGYDPTRKCKSCNPEEESEL